MTSSAPQFVSGPVPTSARRGVRHPWLMATGILDLVLTHLGAVGYALLGIGLGTCSGADGSGGCGSATLRYDLAGCALALNAAVGVATVVLARPTRRALTRRTLVTALVVGVTTATVAAVALWSAFAGASS